MTERRKPEERRREIADAVLKIVAERGLGRLTAAELAREVGVTDAALFHHFRSMDEITVAAIDRVEELLFEELPDDGAAPLDRLGRFFRQRVATIHRHPGAGRLVLSDVLAQVAPKKGVDKVRAFRRRSVGFVRSCLEDARREGHLARGLEVEDATVLVFGSLMALTQAAGLVVPRGSSVDALAQKVWGDLELLLRRRSPGAARLRREPPPTRAPARPKPQGGEAP